MVVDGEDSEDDTPLEQTVGGAVMALTFLVGFGLMFAGVPYFWVAFPVGFAGVLPMSIGAVRWYQQRADEEPTEGTDPLDELRDRYARGELTEAEFERQVEDLLETAEGVPERPDGETRREPESE